MTEEDFVELTKLYTSVSDAVTGLFHDEQTSNASDDESIDDEHFYGRVCKYARLVMSELEDIGVMFPSGPYMLDDIHTLQLIGHMGLFDTDKCVEWFKGLSKAKLKELYDISMIDDLDDWFGMFISELSQSYPFSEDLSNISDNTDKIMITDKFKSRVLKIMDHLLSKQDGEL